MENGDLIEVWARVANRELFQFALLNIFPNCLPRDAQNLTDLSGADRFFHYSHQQEYFV